MRQVIEVSIFLASPGDVTREREEAAKWVAMADRIAGRQHGIRIELIGWEIHSRPGVGAYGQDVINTQIGEMGSYDLFVGILWNRYGQPTPVAGSGTEEEFERAITSRQAIGRPNIWLYFSQAPSTATTQAELEQKTKVLDFRQRAQGLGCLTRNYPNSDEFGRLFFEHLMGWIGSQERPSTDASQAPSSSQASFDQSAQGIPDTHQVLKVPLAYQLNALEQLLLQLKRDRHQNVHLKAFGRLLQNVLLRNGFNPMYEPLTLAGVQEALAQLTEQGRVRIEGNQLIVL